MHVAFGDVLEGEFDSPEALAEEIDRQIHDNYKLFPINELAAGNDDVAQNVKDKLSDETESVTRGQKRIC